MRKKLFYFLVAVGVFTTASLSPQTTPSAYAQGVLGTYNMTYETSGGAFVNIQGSYWTDKNGHQHGMGRVTITYPNGDKIIIDYTYSDHAITANDPHYQHYLDEFPSILQHIENYISDHPLN